MNPARVLLMTCLMCAASSCAYTERRSPGDVEVTVERTVTVAPRGRASVLVQDVKARSSLGACDSFATRAADPTLTSEERVAVSKAWSDCLGSADTRRRNELSLIAAAELRTALSKDCSCTVLAQKASLSPTVTVEVSVTEFVPDVTAKGSKLTAPTWQAGTIVNTVVPFVAASVPLLAPVGGLLVGFDAITGIPINSDAKSVVGTVALEVVVLDAKGTVLHSEPVHATFGRRVEILGEEEYGWYSGRAEGSTPEDAVRAAMEASVKAVMPYLR